MLGQDMYSTDELFKQVAPYMLELLKAAPRFGSAGITIVFHDGKISRIESSKSVQCKIND